MKRNVFLTGILALALVFGLMLTACDDNNGDDGDNNGSNNSGDDNSGGGDTNDPPAGATGETLYTYNGKTGLGDVYQGNGAVQKINAMLSGPNSSPTSIGEIGSISADGKLTLSIPATIDDSKLLPFGDGGVLVGGLATEPSLYLAKGEDALEIMYFNQAFDYTISGTSLSLKKGWNYVSGSGTVVTDTSGYKWGIREEN
jgi:hypothetical protein